MKSSHVSTTTFSTQDSLHRGELDRSIKSSHEVEVSILDFV
uniref:Uncharacterized protein n=1 Tax=Arundo donax TaxID=35708 RepID=A0A0A9DJZ7_ARUDO